MKITIEATPLIVVCNGVPTRMWRGVTAEGNQCELFIALIRVANNGDLTGFERELMELPPPVEEAIDIRTLD
jgi:hypothetical protein